MQQGQPYDDVAGLCRSVQMDPSAYKVFDFALVTKPVDAPETADEKQAVLNPRPITAGSVDSGPEGGSANSDVLSAFANGQNTASEPNIHNDLPVSPVGEPAIVSAAALLHSRDMLVATPARESVSNGLSALAAVHGRPSDSPVLLPIVSSGGGSGATTVLAGLGRALSILGERVLLVDARGRSTLDYFFQANTVKTNLLLSTNRGSQFEGAVHVLRTHSEAAQSSQSYSTKFCRATAGLRGHLDRVLIAGGEWSAPTLDNRAWPGGVCLVILTPDMRSVMAVPSILQSAAERSRKEGCLIEPRFILNRFVETSAVHAALRARLAAQLGPLLLPICIPESDFVEQALMQETNVLDMAPESAFADACFDLAEWYRTTSENIARLSSPAKETQLVTERS